MRSTSVGAKYKKKGAGGHNYIYKMYGCIQYNSSNPCGLTIEQGGLALEMLSDATLTIQN